MNVREEVRKVIPHGSTEEVRAAIESNISLIAQHLDSMKPGSEKAEPTRVLYNLLLKAKVYLHCLSSSLEEATEQLAFVARSLFELSLLTKYVLRSEENLKRFDVAYESDSKDIFEGMLEKGAATTEEQAEDLRIAIKAIEASLKRKDRALRRLPRWKEIAVELRLEGEYNALYKLFSKYVHPTSFSLNLESHIFHDSLMRNCFIYFSQQYAYEIFDVVSIETAGVSILDDWVFKLLA